MTYLQTLACRSRSTLATHLIPGILTSCAVLLLAAPAQADDATQGVPDHESLALYSECARAAESRILSYAEALACSHAFLALKLSFLPDITPGQYRDMTAAERADVNRRGYLAYRAWMDASPEGGGVALAEPNS